MHRLVLAVLAVLSLTWAHAARADEVAPSLEGQDLRASATLVLGAMRTALPAGVYVAFDSSQADPIAQAACDNDGDYVVLVSDAMLRLSAELARVSLYDDANHTAKLDEYATFLADNQTPGRRILPPAAGSFALPLVGAGSNERLFGILAFVIARELEHVRANDLTCAHPTATKETGDDTWSAAEATAAAETAKHVYPGDQRARDRAALYDVKQLGLAADGPATLLRFFTKLEAAPSRFHPSYLATHPDTAKRVVQLTEPPAR